jgi:endonuclease YncB( thermonuclease family)
VNARGQQGVLQAKMSVRHGIVTPMRLIWLALVVGCSSVTTSSTGLLHAARGGDGDSWKDTQGVEYRLGMVNTPELNECFGVRARTERQHLVAHGFRAQAYTKDRYGRSVSVITLADGRNLNVYLARHGFANDKYLVQFRSENPSLAADLDVAFAAAKREHAGLWGAC